MPRGCLFFHVPGILGIGAQCRAQRQQWCSVKGPCLRLPSNGRDVPGPWWQHRLEQVPVTQEGAGASHRALQEGWRSLELQGILVAKVQDPALGSVEPPASPRAGWYLNHHMIEYLHLCNSGEWYYGLYTQTNIFILYFVISKWKCVYISKY